MHESGYKRLKSTKSQVISANKFVFFCDKLELVDGWEHSNPNIWIHPWLKRRERDLCQISF